MRALYSKRFSGEYDPTIRDLKRSVVARIQQARANGTLTKDIADASGESINASIIYDMLNAERFSKDVWLMVDGGLKSLGY